MAARPRRMYLSSERRPRPSIILSCVLVLVFFLRSLLNTFIMRKLFWPLG
uniref:Uncharacterized protein n=1 Tax=Arundo donax TaxID=35708 RepID=A0A0A8ZFM2_ARUDO